MHKKIICFFLILMVLFSCIHVKAYSTVNAIVSPLDNKVEIKSETCESILGDPLDETSFAYFLQEAFVVIQWAGPILCVVLSLVEFIKASASQDKDALVKAIKKSIKRFIFAVVLFFLPLLVNFILGNVLGWYGTCGIG